MQKKILVTGGAGFIGSHTVVALHEAGYQPVIVDNFVNSERKVPARIARIIGQEVSLHEVDCNDAEAMSEVFAREKDLAGIIHFAAFKSVSESVREPLKYYQNNLGSLVVLLGLMEKFQVNNLVFSSSCTVYGEPESLPVTEASPIKPAQSPYGFTKQACERIIQDQALATGLRTILLRYFNPIGAHPSGLIGELPLGRPENLVPYITQTAAGLRDELTVFGTDYQTPDGSAIRDYIHVMDLAEAHVRALDRLNQGSASEPCEIFNIGTGRGASVLELIHEFERVNGLKLPYKLGERRPGDVEQIWADVAHAEAGLGWNAMRSMGDALKDAWTWQQNLTEK